VFFDETPDDGNRQKNGTGRQVRRNRNLIQDFITIKQTQVLMQSPLEAQRLLCHHLLTVPRALEKSVKNQRISVVKCFLMKPPMMETVALGDKFVVIALFILLAQEIYIASCVV